MKTFLKTAAIGVTALVLSATSASALTTWSNFEANGFDVKARYNSGTLTYIEASNPNTGAKFSGKITAAGIALIKTGEKTMRIDLDTLDSRLKSRTTLQDLAQVK